MTHTSESLNVDSSDLKMEQLSKAACTSIECGPPARLTFSLKHTVMVCLASWLVTIIFVVDNKVTSSITTQQHRLSTNSPNSPNSSGTGGFPTRHTQGPQTCSVLPHQLNLNFGLSCCEAKAV